MSQHIADPPPPFSPRSPEPDGTVTWIHLGDLHMRSAGEKNDVDLGRLISVLNDVYAAQGVSFVYLPGDIADDGSAAAYRLVRSHLNRLQLPWCGIVGDHDVQEQSFTNFQASIDAELTGSFVVGRYRFLRLNAFAVPRPDAFVVDDAQLAWVEAELEACAAQQQRAVLLLHCYPSDLKQGGDKLTALLHRHRVLLVDMGHTHYNELSNDGRVLYSATRSTGQIEEGPVGFSVITLDGEHVSWHFVQPDAPGLVNITSPADRRLTLQNDGEAAALLSFTMTVRAKVWARSAPAQVTATLQGAEVPLVRQAGVLWSAEVPVQQHATATLRVEATTEDGTCFASSIELLLGDRDDRNYSPVDQENAIGKWDERGILGTQLGPNKNGREW